MADDQTAAIQALIKQVETLTTRLDGVQKHNVRLLDQIKDKKRANPKPDTNALIAAVDRKAEQQRMADAGFSLDADGHYRIPGHQSDGAIVLTREQARDSKQYKEARDKALEQDVPLRIASDQDDPTQVNMERPDVAVTKTITFDDDHERVRYIREDMHGGDGMIRRSMAAEQEGYKVKTFRTPDDLPDHARTKFDLMETAHDS
ncbi:MAG: hypothetical protein KUG70_14750 [Rhodobacteraceae bacterium]|nr:hypothetical protein [Paracoccaceae bacterium]